MNQGKVRKRYKKHSWSLKTVTTNRLLLTKAFMFELCVWWNYEAPISVPLISVFELNVWGMAMGGLYTKIAASRRSQFIVSFLFLLLLLLEITYAIVGKCSTYGLVRNRFFRERVSFRIWNVGSSTYMPHTVNPVVDIIPSTLGLTVIHEKNQNPTPWCDKAHKLSLATLIWSSENVLLL